jgi:hypothetical protein
VAALLLSAVGGTGWEAGLHIESVCGKDRIDNMNWKSVEPT